MEQFNKGNKMTKVNTDTDYDKVEGEGVPPKLITAVTHPGGFDNNYQGTCRVSIMYKNAYTTIILRKPELLAWMKVLEKAAHKI